MEENIEIRKELQNYLDVFQFLYEGTDEYFFVWDINGGRIHFAGDIYQRYPLPNHGKEGNTIEECKKSVYPRDLKTFEKQLKSIMRGRQKFCDVEFRVKDKEGSKVWVSCKGKCRLDEEGNAVFALGRVSSRGLIYKMDTLTGLLNADRFMEDMQRCQTQSAYGYLVIFGIDNFKHINIKYGRNYGNHVLKRVSEIMEDKIDSAMNVYRLDGDRFAVMLPKAEEQTVEKLYADVQKSLEEYCTVSAGSAFCSPGCESDCSMIYQYAEMALDRAKENGKNMLVFFQPEYYDKRLESIRLLEEMRRSIADECRGFYLCYQPLVDGEDLHLYGCEVLLRYESPVGGKVGPVEFISLLEQTELINPVGEWVLRTALKQCKEWRKQVPEFHINVNMSYVQLQAEGICGKILKIVEESGLPGSALTLEVTESMQLQDYQYFNKIFHHWNNAGIKISIDDFGTGYSSLSYLKSIEIDEVKIDRCFVANIQDNAYNHRLLNNMIELAHTAEIKVCCEGIETHEEIRAIQELKPDILQGYLFSKPCDSKTFERMCISGEDAPQWAQGNQ